MDNQNYLLVIIVICILMVIIMMAVTFISMKDACCILEISKWIIENNTDDH
jgi:hypothetical protein